MYINVESIYYYMNSYVYAILHDNGCMYINIILKGMPCIFSVKRNVTYRFAIAEV
jgi:hypothetical protein